MSDDGSSEGFRVASRCEHVDQSDLVELDWVPKEVGVGSQRLPSDGAFELDDAHAEDEILVELQGLVVSSQVYRLEGFDSLVIAPILAHLYDRQPTSLGDVSPVLDVQ